MKLISGPARSVVLLLVLALAASVGPIGAAAADPLPTTQTGLSAPASGPAGRPVPFTAAVTDAAQTPVVGAIVQLQRLTSTWVTVGSGTTDATGTVVVDGVLPVGTTSWRATYAGDATHAPSVSPVVKVLGQRVTSRLLLTGPRRVVDERSARLSMLWTASDGRPVPGLLTVYRRLGSGAWSAYRRLRANAAGRVTLNVVPRSDSTWRAIGTAGTWWLADSSDPLPIDNVPPTSPVAYPAAAPRPAGTPVQGRAVGAGANPVITRIPNGTWSSMVGRSWHRGCPLGRSGLRLLRINYWGFNGYRYRGEMVLSSAVAGRAAAALRDMYNGRFPIRRMYRVDRFGWSKKLRGANDYASMRADNTSSFNCRSVVNRPGVLSPHARGRAVDVNTWENPYRSATGLVPNTWWASRSHPLIAWRSSSHPVVRIWRAHGFRWTYGTGDSQHVDGRGVPPAGSFTG